MASHRALVGLAVGTLSSAVVNGAWSDGHADIDRPGHAFKELSLDAQAEPAACFVACQVRDRGQPIEVRAHRTRTHATQC